MPRATTGTGSPRCRRRSLGSRRLAHARKHLFRRQPGPLRRHHRRQSLGPGSRHACRTWSITPTECRTKSCAHGLPELSAPFRDAAVTVPAGTHVHILLDRKTLTTAYPLLTVSGGKGAHIRLTYSEALYDKNNHKGDRDEVDDRTALGLTDSFLPDGGAHRIFEPLWWRTWRYLDLDIQTGRRAPARWIP